MWRISSRRLMWLSLGALWLMLAGFFGWLRFEGQRQIRVQIRNDSALQYSLVQTGAGHTRTNLIAPSSSGEIYFRGQTPFGLLLRDEQPGGKEWQLEGYIEPNQRGTILILIRKEGEIVQRSDLKFWGLF